MTQENLEDKLRELAKQADQISDESEETKEPFDVMKFIRENNNLFNFGSSSKPKEKDTSSYFESPKIDFNKYEEEKVKVIEGPVSVSIGYRRYTFAGKIEEAIYVIQDKKEKEIYKTEDSIFSINNQLTTEHSIQNIALSPDQKRIVFETKKHKFGLSKFSSSNIWFNDSKKIIVVNIDGSYDTDISYNISVDLPKHPEKKNSESNSLLSHIYIPLSSKKEKLAEKEEFYSPKWIAPDTLELKGQLHYETKLFHYLKSDSFIDLGTYMKTGPECTIHVRLNKENEIKNAKIVKQAK
jgi:hypothetical protein